MSELRFVFDTFSTEQARHFVVVFLPVGRTIRSAVCCQAYQDHRLRSSAADPPDKMLEAQEISILLPSSRRRRSRRRRSGSRRHRVFIGDALLQRTIAIRSAKGSLNADCLAIQCTVILDLCLSASNLAASELSLLHARPRLHQVSCKANQGAGSRLLCDCWV